MIPDMNDLRRVAADVLERIPEGLERGEVATGLYGMGFLGRWALPRLKTRGVRLAACFDANEAMRGTLCEEVPVCVPTDLRSAPPEFMVITARHAVATVSDMLSDLAIPHVSCDAWYVAEHLTEFHDIHDRVLHDDHSKDVLRAVLMTMLTGDSAFCAAVFEEDQYFCLPLFSGLSDEHFVDAGAYDGDSVERFIVRHHGRFSKIYAFEPGPRQFCALKARREKLISTWALDSDSIELVNAGLGDGDYSTAAASINGQMTNLAIGYDAGKDSVALDVASLDGFMRGRRITFLKADVEGMEMALLKGARATIWRHKPKIAICVYHYPTDIPSITNYLTELVPDYKFALRHHAPQFMETVLYCSAD